MATQHIFTLSDVYRQSQEGTWVLQGWNAGWFGGGGQAPAKYTTVDRILFSADTVTAVAKGPLSQARLYLAATGNVSDGWFGGGHEISPAAAEVSTVDRVIFSSDTATAVAKGPLSAASYALGATGNTTDGWWGGGYRPGNISTVERVIFSSDTATAVAKGPLSLARYNVTATGNTTDGWWGGGYVIPWCQINR